MVSDTKRGALVGRLSMGRPASNGDFSGVIKNSFAISDGRQGSALSETMITGNVAQMLKDVVAVSRERIDTGPFLLPWVRIGNLHFS
jgi:PmbA protein